MTLRNIHIYMHIYVSLPIVTCVQHCSCPAPNSLCRCEDLFKGLSPKALLAASGPADSWECLNVRVALFEDQDPFWWRREHPEDEAERAQSLAEELERRRLDTGGGDGDGDGAYDGPRRDALLQQRTATAGTPEADIGRGGYTDLEVLDVLDPARAARIRLRQARYGGALQ